MAEYNGRESRLEVPHVATRRTRVDVLVVVLPVLLAVACGVVLLRPHYLRMDERDALLKIYGDPRYSFGVEELAVRDFFRDRRAGIFVNIGASHCKNGSNTYYLETQLEWSGLAVDALQEYQADYQRYRPRTKFMARFVSDVSGNEMTLLVPADMRHSTSSWRPDIGPAQERRVKTITLNDLLDQEQIARIDFLSIDIELSEPKALAGFDVERYRPALVCIEAWQPVRQEILDCFAVHGYTVVGKYLRADFMNLYFAPLPLPQ